MSPIREAGKKDRKIAGEEGRRDVIRRSNEHRRIPIDAIRMSAIGSVGTIAALKGNELNDPGICVSVCAFPVGAVT
jgi:hypothetical protein